MNAKKYLITVIVVFVVYSGLAYLIHEVLLEPDYQGLTATIRSFEEMTRRVPLLYLSNLIFSLAFCLIYVKGYEAGKSWVGQGVRFGLITGTLLAPLALTQYVVYPVPAALALKWIAFGYAQILITALVAAGLYQTQAQPSQ